MKRGLIVLSALIGVVAMASADINYSGTYAGKTVDISGTHYNGSVFAGKLNFSNPGNTLGLGELFQTVCVDLDHTLNGNSFPVDLIDSNVQGGGIKLAGNIVKAFFAAAGSSNNNCAALQLAVWEAVYDGADDIANNGAAPDWSHGEFKTSASATIKAQAATYFAAITTPGGAYYLKPNPQTTHGQGQMTLVPEPGSIAALGLGALVLLRSRKTSRRL